MIYRVCGLMSKWVTYWVGGGWMMDGWMGDLLGG